MLPGFYLSNCSLKLEDVPPLRVTAMPENSPIKTGPGGSLDFPVYLTNGEVIYDGGPIPHDAGFVFVNCTFDLRTTDVPAEPARDLLNAALNSDDLNRISVDLAATHS